MFRSAAKRVLPAGRIRAGAIVLSSVKACSSSGFRPKRRNEPALEKAPKIAGVLVVNARHQFVIASRSAVRSNRTNRPVGCAFL